MRVEPDSTELLRVAREKLLEELLPQIPEGGRYAARMIANAIVIAARELEGAGGDPAAELARLRSLMPEWNPASHDMRVALREGNARLAGSVRAGRFDADPHRGELLEHLRRTTEERLAVSNPRLLTRKTT
jgi:hypothetical protein